MDELPSHLGGHKNKTHLDEGTIDYLIKKFKPKTFLDIGCGPGGMVSVASNKGLKAKGIDGDWLVERDANLQDKIHIHDYTQGPSKIGGKYDLVWSTEFLEHVDEQYQKNYMTDFAKGKWALVTFAPPGKGGHHHVNCQTAEYWIDVFANYGFEYDDVTTQTVRKATTMGRVKTLEDGTQVDKHRFVANNGLFFSKLG